MALSSPKDYASKSNYPRALSSIIISVGLLAVFITLASWILLSHPIGSVVRGYFYGVDQTSDLGLPMSWDGSSGSQVGGEGKSDVSGLNFPKSEGVTDPGLTQNVGESLPKSEGVVGSDKSHNVGDTILPKFESGAEPDKNKNVGDTSLPKSEGKAEPGQFQSVGDTSLPKLEGGAEHDRNKNVGDTSLPKSEGTAEPRQYQNVSNMSLPKETAKLEQNQITEVSQEKDITTSGDDTMPKERTTEKPVPMEVRDSPKSEIKNGISVEKHVSETSAGTEHKQSLELECDLYHGEWFYDTAGPLYTNNSCPVITQMQNCQGNGRPDKEYENWRWRPAQCELPRFNATKFLELMSGKTLAFVGDSVARNQMESLLCLLWQVEVPKNRGNRHMQRWHFRSKSVMIARIWSSWLVHQTGEAFGGIQEGVAKLHLDVPDEGFMKSIPTFDVVVVSSGHWFAKQSIYIMNNEIVGAQLWSLPKEQPLKVNNIEAFGISVETSLTAMVTHPNYTGLTIVRAYSPDHYEGGAWNTGGSCTGKVRPILPGQLVENDYTNTMHEKQVSGFYRAIKKQINRSKLKLMDITEPFSYRHDGHPGPYRSPDPNKITQRGPDGKPPPQDCLHWCMPGPVDTWNELVLETIRREFDGNKNSGV